MLCGERLSALFMRLLGRKWLERLVDTAATGVALYKQGLDQEALLSVL
jgi:hypothetical protein